MKTFFLVMGVLAVPAAFAANTSLHLLHDPAMNRTQIIFSYAGDLWTVGRQGGNATRLTSGAGIEDHPVFSPDGETIAFTGEYDGNVDVYTMPATGGVPRRITYHPGADYRRGMDPGRKENTASLQPAKLLPIYAAFHRHARGRIARLPCLSRWHSAGRYSPDGQRMVYAPLDGGQFGRTPARWVAWNRYRGGEASYLWIINFADLSIEKIPRTDSNDINPMWVGDKVYFLSDRNGPMTLFRYEPATKAVTELIKNNGTAFARPAPVRAGSSTSSSGRSSFTTWPAERAGRCPSRSMPT